MEVTTTTVHQVENKFQSCQSMCDDQQSVFDFKSMQENEHDDEDSNSCDFDCNNNIDYDDNQTIQHPPMNQLIIQMTTFIILSSGTMTRIYLRD